jgi:hypothetical protein
LKSEKRKKIFEHAYAKVVDVCLEGNGEGGFVPQGSFYVCLWNPFQFVDMGAHVKGEKKKKKGHLIPEAARSTLLSEACITTSALQYQHVQASK